MPSQAPSVLAPLPSPSRLATLVILPTEIEIAEDGAAVARYVDYPDENYASSSDLFRALEASCVELLGDAFDDESIRDLAREAAVAGDAEQSSLCASALLGDADAREECADVILEALLA